MATPMRRQYLEIKGAHPDAILFYRLGDFYETFDEDAELVARVCGITLTSRPVSRDQRVPLAGVPYHSADGYIAKLIHAGYRVAIAEQSPNPDDPSLMQRQVVRIVSPGTLTDEALLQEDRNNYLLALAEEQGRIGLAYIDASTGEFWAREYALPESAAAHGECLRLAPAEVVLLQGQSTAATIAPADVPRHEIEAWRLSHTRAHEALLRHFQVASLAPFGLDGHPAATVAAALCLHYLAANQSEAVVTASLRFRAGGDSLQLDPTALRTLEVVQAASTGERHGSLLSVMDMTLTPMGSRLLRRRLLEPSMDLAEIERRLDAIQSLAEDDGLRERLRAALKRLPDLERLAARTAQDNLTPRRALAIAQACRAAQDVVAALQARVERLLGEACGALNGLDPATDVAEAIEAAIDPEPPATLNDAGFIRHGFDAELDRIVERATNARGLLADMEERERERTGLRSLRIGHNNVFGYFLELPKSQAERAPDYFVRKQTLVNAERFFTEELKALEADVYGAQDRRLERERLLWSELADRLRAQAPRLAEAARRLAVLDVTAGLAEVARRERWARPQLDNSGDLEIRGGRHPVVEAFLRVGSRSFVPNNTTLSTEAESVVVLTGPNMAGKSTYLRQVALIVVAAQAGSFVPAESARIGLVDRIFTRIGAQDELASGQSTFMVEMLEVASILRQATGRSLVVLDEVGRGTSTYDGMAIARAVVEHLHNAPHLNCRTLFATHYHELTDLEQYLPRVRNYNVVVAESEGGIVFTHQIVRGGADRSYGIHVAGLAGVPQPVLRRATEVLATLEAQRLAAVDAPAQTPSARQLGLFTSPDSALTDEVAGLAVEELTPIEAMNTLADLRARARALRKRRRG